jgi:hypothetical protein
MIDANFIRGTVEDMDPDNGRVWTVAVPRFGLWFCTVAAGTLAKLKDYFDLKSSDQQLPLTYGTFDLHR